MKLDELLQRSGPWLSVEGNTDIDISTIVSDSRRVCPGCLFLCIRGMKSDSHLYINEACAAGAVAIVVEDERVQAPKGITIIHSDDTRASLARLWCARYELSATDASSMKLVAVTGTNGKTTVSYMLRTIFRAAMHPSGIIGTVRCETPLRVLDNLSNPELQNSSPNANMTTPDPENLYRMLDLMRKDGAEYVFIEATSHALALRKLESLCFETAIFTGLTPDHLDFHKNMENYFLAKAHLLELSRSAIINIDDRWGERFLRYAKDNKTPASGRLSLCSMRGGNCEYRALDIRDMGSEGVCYTLASARGMREIRCPIPGMFTVMNSLQAAACASELGISGTAVSDAIGAMSGAPVPGRLERIRLGNNSLPSVFIDYAHTPDALRNLLITARGFLKNSDTSEKNGKIILLFGCGGDRDKTKRPVMGEIASQFADFTIITSDNSRSERPQDIIDDILRGFDGKIPHKVIPDRREAIFFAVSIAKAEDIVLLAGKGHEQYEITASGRKPFSEAEILRQAVEFCKRKQDI